MAIGVAEQFVPVSCRRGWNKLTLDLVAVRVRRPMSRVGGIIVVPVTYSTTVVDSLATVVSLIVDVQRRVTNVPRVIGIAGCEERAAIPVGVVVTKIEMVT